MPSQRALLLPCDNRQLIHVGTPENARKSKKIPPTMR